LALLHVVFFALAPPPLKNSLSSSFPMASGIVKTVHVKGGGLFSWGSGEMGQLGLPTETVQAFPKDADGYPFLTTPTAVGGNLQRYAQVAGGDGHSAAVTSQGRLFTWGASACGQLGHTDMDHTMPKDVENYPYQPVPRMVKALGGMYVVAVACGDAHTVVLTSTGAVYSWGGGGCGQLGHSGSSRMLRDDDGCPYQPLPCRVEGLPSDITSVACGKAHTAVCSRTSGAVFTWGAGACGQLGHPDTMSLPSDDDGYPYQPLPRAIAALGDERVVACAAGDVHTALLTEGGEVFVCGGGSFGQLGQGTDLTSLPVDQDGCPYAPTPLRVPGLEGIGLIESGDQHVLAVDTRLGLSSRLILSSFSAATSGPGAATLMGKWGCPLTTPCAGPTTTAPSTYPCLSRSEG
jgi:alpha-tubulin suppressor-like RCC1 family protein